MYIEICKYTKVDFIIVPRFADIFLQKAQMQRSAVAVSLQSWSALPTNVDTALSYRIFADHTVSYPLGLNP